MTQRQDNALSPVGLAGKWQVPLLLLSMVLLALVGWRYTSHRSRPAWQERFDHLVRLTDSVSDGDYSHADAAAKALLEETPPEHSDRRTAVLLQLAEIQWRAIRHTRDRGAGALETLVQHYRQAEQAGAALDAEAHQRLAEAFADLGELVAATDHLQRAWQLDASRAPALKRRSIELRIRGGRLSDSQRLALLEDYLATPELAGEQYAWALEAVLNLHIAADRLDQARRIIDQALAEAPRESLRVALMYQMARILAHQGQAIQADDILIELAGEADQTDELFSRISLLRGELIWQENPEEALQAFSRVLELSPRTHLATAARVGMGRAHAGARRYDRSLGEYERAVQDLLEQPANPHVRIADLRQALRQTWQTLVRMEQHAQALRYAQAEWRVAQIEVPPPGPPVFLDLLERLGQTHLAVARQLRQQHEASAPLTGDEELAELDRRRRAQLASAGDVFLKLADAATAHDDELYGRSLWNAADAFDNAAQRDRAIEVFTRFIDGRPMDRQIPEAMFRLGQAYQAQGQYAKAIEAYRRNLTRDPTAPRHPMATEGLIPMAACFIAQGPDHYEHAEHILRGILDDNPMITPASELYRKALFGLGELHYYQGKWREAIARLDQAIQRYPGQAVPAGEPDPSGLRAQYLQAARSAFRIAECYQRAAREALARAAREQNLLNRDELRLSHREQLMQARQILGQVIEQFEAMGDQLGELDQAYRRNAYFAQGDCLFELGGYKEAIERYELAVATFPTDPAALGGLVQIYNCHYALGQKDEARKVMNRAAVLMQTIDRRKLDQPGLALHLTSWQQWFQSIQRLDPKVGETP